MSDNTTGADLADGQHWRLFEAVCSNASVAIILLDQRQRCIYMNPAAEALTGYTLAEMRGRPMHDVVHHTRPDGAPYPVEDCPIDRALPRNARVQGEDVLIHKRGDFYPVAFTASPVDVPGVVTGTIVELRDLTSEKDSERALVESEDRYLAIFNQTTVGVVQVDPDGRMVLVNKRWCAMTGYSEAELLRMTIADVTDPEDVAATMEAVRRLADGGPDFEIEKRYRRKDGSVLHACSSVSALRSASGAFVGMVAVVLDISERRRTEAALRESEARLALDLADMKQLQTVSSQMLGEDDAGVLYRRLLDAACAVMRSDMASLQMLDPDRNELRLLAWTGFHPDSARFWDRVALGSSSTCGAALREGARVIVPDIETCGFMAGTADRDEYRRSGIRAVQSTPLVSRAGRLLGIISTHWRAPHRPAERALALLDVLARQAADLIERRQAEDALKAALAEKERLAAHNELIAREMSHRIMNSFHMLQSMLGLQTRSIADPHARAVVEHAFGRVKAMAVVHSRLFEAARDDIAALDLGAYLRGVGEELARAFMADGRCVLRVEAPDGVRIQAGLAAAVGLIATELVLNAVKHAFRAGERGTLTVRRAQAAGRCLLTVADDGVGLPEGLDLAASSGLGMRLVRSLVAQLDGALEIDGKPPGARFRVSFPIPAA